MDFMREFPGIEVSLTEATSPEIIRMVSNGAKEFGVIQVPEKMDSRLRYELLFEEQLVALVPPNHRLARKSRLRITDFHGEKFIEFQGHVREAIAEKFEEFEVAPNNVCDTRELETVRGMVRAGIGLSIVPQSSLPPRIAKKTTRTKRKAEIKHCSLIPKLDRKVGLVFRRDSRLSPSAEKFREMCVSTNWAEVI